MAAAPTAPTPADTVAAMALSCWEANASYWESRIGADGDELIYWMVLQEPCLRRFLTPHLAHPGALALDLATGNGICARWMLAHGATRVLATDGSDSMLELARERC